MTLRIVDLARQEARDAAFWYDQRQLGLGERFLRALRNSLEAIESDPTRFPKIETFKSARDIRRIRLSRFPYTVVFELFATGVVVLAVAHARRRPNYWAARQL